MATIFAIVVAGGDNAPGLSAARTAAALSTMSILTVSSVAKSFAADLLFSDVSFTLAAGQKMGLIGRNGGGKTTLLRIVMGQESPEPSVVGPLRTIVAPRVALAAGRRLGYLRQEAPVHPERTIGEEIELALEPLREAQGRMTNAEHAMSDASDDDSLEKAMAAYTLAHDDFESRGGYEVEAQKDATLRSLGFGPETQQKAVGSCSGGEQTRLGLAKLVLTRPDLLILDEPTNHLDISATEWLEGFLKEYPGAVLLVSHDRYFLDGVVDTIGELENGRLTVYKGNYSHFKRQKEEQIERQLAVFSQQQAEIARLNDLIKRNMGADANASKIRHKTQGRIDRMDKIDAPRSDSRTVRARIDAAGAGRIGREVVRLNDLAKSFGDRTLFSHLNAVVERGDRVGVVGPNGAGKTTLVRILLGEEEPSAGALVFGHNVRRAYFSQHATDDLDITRTVSETIKDAADEFTETQVRSYLARFLFTGDDVFKQVAVLSGGEKNKLALARMLLTPCNLLILDEPTNHLDIESCETLTQMLTDYAGTLLLISHDRYLLNAVTNKTLGLIGDGRARMVEGNYASWRAELDAESAPAPRPPKPVAALTAPEPAAPSHNLSPRELSKARTRAQQSIERTESAVHAAEAQLAATESALSAGDGDLVALAARHTRQRAEVDAAIGSWEQALAELEALR